MDKHGKAVAAFLGSPLAGAAFAFVAYGIAGGPCSTYAGIDAGACVFGQPVGDAAQGFGLIGLLLGGALALGIENS